MVVMVESAMQCSTRCMIDDTATTMRIRKRWSAVECGSILVNEEFLLLEWGVKIRSVLWSPTPCSRHCDAHELGTFPPRTYQPLKCVPVGHLRKKHTELGRDCRPRADFFLTSPLSRDDAVAVVKIPGSGGSGSTHASSHTQPPPCRWGGCGGSSRSMLVGSPPQSAHTRASVPCCL